jgi:hypothetical protein
MDHESKDDFIPLGPPLPTDQMVAPDSKPVYYAVQNQCVISYDAFDRSGLDVIYDAVDRLDELLPPLAEGRFRDVRLHVGNNRRLSWMTMESPVIEKRPDEKLWSVEVETTRREWGNGGWAETVIRHETFREADRIRPRRHYVGRINLECPLGGPFSIVVVRKLREIIPPVPDGFERSELWLDLYHDEPSISWETSDRAIFTKRHSLRSLLSRTN